MILEKAQGNNTKFFALQVLEEAVKVSLTLFRLLMQFSLDSLEDSS